MVVVLESHVIELTLVRVILIKMVSSSSTTWSSDSSIATQCLLLHSGTVRVDVRPE